ncbi:MAG TPA: pyridoxamine 5'-phosphate oxidase [Kofleriaceae bacterium]
MAKDLLWKVGEQYDGSPLDPADCDPDPFVEVRRWLALAIDGGLPTANAMTLATVDERDRPAARMVLLKEVDDRGFVFYTSYDSRKARDLSAHSHAALVLYWEPLHRQIRIEGSVEKISAAESDAYFVTRPRGSQFGAIASPQSEVLANREVLERRVAALVAKYGEGANERPIERPLSWGGYRVVPDMIELWQGQPSRLHDRVRYRLSGGVWIRERLAP